MQLRASLLAGLSILFLAGCAQEEPKDETPVGATTAQAPLDKMPDDDIHRGLSQPTISMEAPKPKLADLKKSKNKQKRPLARTRKTQRQRSRTWMQP